jgi:hypothetical protein
MKKLVLLLCTLAFFVGMTSDSDAGTAVDVVALTPDDVAAMQARLPPEAHPHAKPAGYDRAGDAKRVAAAIARRAGSYRDAALAVTYAAYESSNQVEAKGDLRDGEYHSFGVFQLNEHTPKTCAFDPDCAVGVWLSLVEDAETRCGRNPPDERLAVIASGSCDLGRTKVRVRAQIAQRILPLAKE